MLEPTASFFSEIPFLSLELYGTSLTSWLVALLLTLLGAIILRGLIKLAAKRIKSFRRVPDIGLAQLIAGLLEHTNFFVVLLASGVLATEVTVLPGHLVTGLHTVFTVALLVQVGVWASSVVTFLLERYLKTADQPSVQSALGLLSFAAKVVVWSAITLLILDNVGIDITALVAGLGVGGVAVALAVQNILGDVFASLSIVLDKPFEVGDFIIIGDFLGSVERIGIKTTRVKSISGEQIIFSNSDLLSSRIRNYKRMYERRVIFSIGVIYQTPREKLQSIPVMLRELIESRDNVRFDRAHFARYGASSLDFEIVYYVLSPDYNLYMDIQQAINFAIFERFEAEGLEFAYPTQTIFLEKTAAQ